MPNSIYFGGTLTDPLGSSMVYLGGPSYGLTVLLDDIDALASVMVDMQDVPYGFGGASWGTHHPSKRFLIPCVVRGTSFSDTKSKLDALNLVLDKNRLCALRFDDWNDRYWMVRFTGRSAVSLRQMGATFNLEFIAPDPRAYSVDETTQTINISGATAFTVPASGVLAGTAEPDVVWLLKPTGSGATSPVVLSNETRDEIMTWQNALTTAQWLRVTATARQEIVERTGDSGATYTPVNSSLLSGSRFPKLSPNVANDCELSGFASTGTLTVTYRARYN